MTLRVLQEAGIDAAGLRSKSVGEVLGKASVRTAIVVCAQAAESCPRLFRFTRDLLQWPLDDQGEEMQLAAFRRLHARNQGGKG